MAITTRDELIETLALVGVMGAARNGDLDGLFTGGSGGDPVTSNDITDATTTGKAVLTATNGAAARTAIGAGTSSLAIGTTATTAKAGNYVPTYTEVTGKPATFPPTIGTTATTAKAGNYTPTLAEVATAVTSATTVPSGPQATDTLLIMRGGVIHTVTLQQISDFTKTPI